MDGIKKTALLLSGLEWKTVDTLLSKLDADSAKAVRRAMMSLGTISSTETNRIAGEFLNTAGVNRFAHSPMTAHSQNQYRTRSKNAESHGRRAIDAQKQNESEQVPRGALQKPFQYLRHFSTEMIAKEILGEHAQTIAIVLAHLPTSRAGEVLECLPESVQIDVARRLHCFDLHSSADFVPEIDSVLKQRFENLPSHEQRSRHRAIFEHLLKSTNRETQERIQHLVYRDENEITDLF